MSTIVSRRCLLALLALLPHTCRGKSALLIVDVQDCFLPGGSLGVTGADSIIPKINDLIANASCLFDMVVRTRDYHPSGHISFGSTHGLPAFADLPPPFGLGKGELSITCLKPESDTTADAACCPTYYLNKSSFDCSTQLCPADGSASWDYDVNMSGIVMNNTACSMCASNPDLCFETTQRMWTDHCEQTGDSTLASSLLMTENEKLILKGKNLFVDAYSAFMDNSRNLRTVLDEELQANGVTELYIVGIASDVCVMYTVRDALHSSTGNYSVTVVSDATAGITPESHAAAISTFQTMEDVTLLTTAEVVASACPETTTGTEMVVANQTKTALLIVDVQDCFLPGGSLGVTGADSIIPKINDLIANASCLFDMVVRTRDYHPSGHISFGSTHGLPAFADLPPPFGLGKGELSITCLKPESDTTADAACCPTYYLNKSSFDCSTQLCPADGSAGWDYDVNMSGIVMNNTACSMCASNPDLCFETTQRMWTDHCEQTGDSTLASSLLMTENEKLILKGTNLFVDAYSAFMDNSRNLRTVLDEELQANGVTELYIVGIASDVCVMYTVRDALHSSTGKYSVTVVSDATAGITPESHAAAISTFQAMEDVTLLTTAEVVASACPETTTGSETMSTEMMTSTKMMTSTEMSGGTTTESEDTDADSGFVALPGVPGVFLVVFAAIWAPVGF